MKHIGALLVTTALALPAWAHDGEIHGEAAALPGTTEMAPRATDATEEFELVAVLAGDHLTLYLDRFATNEPVAGATVEVEGDGWKAVAAPVVPGVYALPAAALASPGRHPLTVSVEAGDLADLLTLSLDSPRPVAQARAARGWDVSAAGLSGTLLLAGAGFLALRRSKAARAQGRTS